LSSAATLSLHATAAGLTLHGPFFFTGFKWLDSTFGKAATFRNAITKSLVGQCTLFPTYTPMVLLYASLLVDGNNLEQGMDRVKQRLPTVLLTGSAYW
jgi:protein Mpv17